ncbi:MAG: hypothetical protein IT355_16155 [Gemmatimonadaceae bacterium]|nr:hypothetical protein [Gemmatimonadaceae bacterium]
MPTPRALLRSTATALTLAALLTACGDGATAPADSGISAAVAAATTLDVATIAGDAAKEDVEMFRVNRGAFGIAQATDFERFARWETCPFDTTTARFTCTTRTRGPFSLTRSYAYADEQGAAQSAFSATTTASANFKWTLTGEITRKRWSGTMSRSRDITLSGLLGANTSVTVNGTGAAERQRTVFLRDSSGANGLTRSYDMEASLAIANVVTPAIRLPDAWPLSGTVTRNYTVVRTDATNGTTTTVRNSVVTFNGTQFAALVVNGKEFILDLDTGEVTPKPAS